MMVKKSLAGVTLAVAAPVGAVLNGDLQAVNKPCAAPLHWDGPVQAAVDGGVYQACQEVGGVQKDAPAVDLSEHPVTLPAPVG